MSARTGCEALPLRLYREQGKYQVKNLEISRRFCHFMCTFQKFIRPTSDVNSYITALCAKRLVTQMLARGICFASDRTSVYTRCNEIITNVLRLTDLKRFILMITVVFKPLWRRIRVSYLRFVLAIQNRYARFDKWIPIIQIRSMKYNSLYSFGGL